MRGTVNLVCGAKAGGAPNQCLDLPDLERQATGVAEVDQACVCEAKQTVHDDGVLLPCVTFKTFKNCGH